VPARVRQNYQPMKLSALVRPGPALTSAEKRRYSRQVVIPVFGEAGQESLKNAKVLCIGAGGLGSPALMYLAAAGVGTLGVVDFDTVDETNLHRQILFGQSDLGKLKVDVAQSKLLEINPNILVHTYPVRLETSNAIEIFAKYDLIIDATDNFSTRYLINDAAVLLKKPYVWGSVNRFDGQVAIFWSEYGPCYRCLHPTPPPPGTVQNCAEAGVLGVLCATVASLQVNEAVKVITGIGDVQIGQLIIYDALEAQYSKVTVNKNTRCELCGSTPSQLSLLQDYEAFCGSNGEISAEELKKMFENNDDFLLIDVREVEELEISVIPGSIHIPQRFFLDLSVLSQLPHDKVIILHCHSGVRSARCLELIQKNGFTNSRHLREGILAWEKL
jgi:molybdopterin/thiamine biosynthesis adenylyltransferase/rhodanese-related sulfurtransferase